MLCCNVGYAARGSVWLCLTKLLAPASTSVRAIRIVCGFQEKSVPSRDADWWKLLVVPLISRDSRRQMHLDLRGIARCV